MSSSDSEANQLRIALEVILAQQLPAWPHRGDVTPGRQALCRPSAGRLPSLPAASLWIMGSWSKKMPAGRCSLPSMYSNPSWPQKSKFLPCFLAGSTNKTTSLPRGFSNSCMNHEGNNIQPSANLGNESDNFSLKKCCSFDTQIPVMFG